MRNVLDVPARAIAENAGKDGSVVVNAIRRAKEKNYGYNADTGEYCDLRKAGVVDPVKVTRSALAERRQRRLSPAHHQSPVSPTSPRRIKRTITTTITAAVAWEEWVAWAVWVAWEEWVA